MKPLKISDFNLRENHFTRNDKSYRVVDIIEIAKNLPIFEMPLCGIDISAKPWGDSTIKNFVYHMKRVDQASLDYPIILDDEGYICDGWHRVTRAILKGDITIKCKRLITMPEPI